MCHVQVGTLLLKLDNAQQMQMQDKLSSSVRFWREETEDGAVVAARNRPIRLGKRGMAW